MAYIGYNDLLNYIDAQNLSAMTNDYDGNAPINMNIISSICQIASDEADAGVSAIYSVPFSTPPPKIRMAAIYFALEKLYQRRLTPQEVNPFTELAKQWRDTLKMINNGQMPLDDAYRRALQPIVAYTYPTRVNAPTY